MKTFLKGKRILFFSANFLGYQNAIKKALETTGATVDYFDERPGNTFMVKALIRINRNLLSFYIEKYYKKIIEYTSLNNYDYIFFIKGESVSSDILYLLRSSHPKAQFILYHWDSIANNRNALRISHCFDVIFSFDQEDCDRYGWRFLPLFYGNGYKEIAEENNYRYALMFIGTTHGDRYKLVRQIRDELQYLGHESYTYFFFPSRLLYLKMILQNKWVRRAPIKEFNFKPMTQDEVISIVAQSNIVFDIQHAKQTGLTMRTIEALGAKRKLLTTNADIVKYDFYNPNNIQIIDRYSRVWDKSFLYSKYVDIPIDIYNKYSIDGWIKAIFEIEAN